MFASDTGEVTDGLKLNFTEILLNFILYRNKDSSTTNLCSITKTKKSERADGIGPTEFSKTMLGCFDGLMDDIVGKFVDSLKDEEGEGITTEKLFKHQLRESTWEDMNLEDTTKEMESSITGNFLNQLKSTQVDFRKVMARRFHESWPFSSQILTLPARL